MQPVDKHEICFCAGVERAAPTTALSYDNGFLAVDAASFVSKLTAQQQRSLRLLAAAALHVDQHDFGHHVQARLGHDRFAYRGVARPRPKTSTKPIAEWLLPSA